MAEHKQPPDRSARYGLSDEFNDGLKDGRTLAQAVQDYRAERGYGDGGWGEYLATKIEQQSLRIDVEEMAREQFSGLFDWLQADKRFDHLCDHAQAQEEGD